MRERPILFSGPMVRAILAGRKTQTRRVVKPQPLYRTSRRFVMPDDSPKKWHDAGDVLALCPYGLPGDRLWVRETWHPGETVTLYRADPGGDAQILRDEGSRWRPSIHMPRRASRLTLELTDIRLERLHDISEADAIAEGVERFAYGEEYGEEHVSHGYGTQRLALGAMAPSARDAFGRLWRDLNGAESWAANPWVWAVEFRRVDAAARAA